MPEVGLPHVIVLSGPSCSGKTTVASALKEMLSTPRRPYLHIEADRFMPHLPAVWVTHDAKQEVMTRVLCRAAASFADHGFDLILDGILPYGRPRELTDALALFGRYQLCYVGVHCVADVLAARERRRSDRVPGWAAIQNEDLHEGIAYNVEIDTTRISAVENARRIRQHLTACGGL